MDITQLDLSEADYQTLHLCHPSTGLELVDEEDDTPVLIQLYSADSDTYRAAVRKFGNKKLNEKKNRKQSIEELEESSASLLATATHGWSGLKIGENELAFNFANAKKLYRDFPWIREQVEDFINDRSNFLKSA